MESGRWSSLNCLDLSCFTSLLTKHPNSSPLNLRHCHYSDPISEAARSILGVFLPKGTWNIGSRWIHSSSYDSYEALTCCGWDNADSSKLARVYYLERAFRRRDQIILPSIFERTFPISTLSRSISTRSSTILWDLSDESDDIQCELRLKISISANASFLSSDSCQR